MVFFFFSSRRRHTRLQGDWSSDVCSSDLTWDAIIVGGGHNGLVSAAYLAKAGLRILVLERRRIVGGACITEEVFPGVKFSRLAYSAGLLRENGKGAGRGKGEESGGRRAFK